MSVMKSASPLLRSGPKTRIKFFLALATILFFAFRLTTSPLDSNSNVNGRNASKKRVLAYYFPQFHEFEENNRFWGKGFTDFTNVAKVTHDPMGFPVARPAERFGFYDLTEKSQRQYQAALAKAYGVSGFIIMHYWFSSKPVMERPLELLLEDGEPDIDFCLMWANEPWTARWDGLNGSEVLLAQTYEKSDWRSHFDWMVRFFKHKNYILVDNKPMLVIYRIVEVQELHLLLVQWQAWAIDAGFDGLHIVQNNGWKFTDDANIPQPGVEGIAEYYPNYYSFFKNMPAPLDQILTSPKLSAHHYYGVTTAWNNFPRHADGGQHGYIPFHPSIFQYVLRQNLARTPPGAFVFANAWNEWGEGAVIEPSIQWGRRWLEAVQTAVVEEQQGLIAELNSDGFASSIPLQPAGVPAEGGGNVCIIVRTFSGHEAGLYNIYQLLSSLVKMTHREWTAFIAITDSSPFPNLPSIVASYNDERLEIVSLPDALRDYDSNDAAYEATDHLIKQQCIAGNFDWVLITNGDNWYAPDALNSLPNDADMVLMNFYSRYQIINAEVLTGAKKVCCRLVQNLPCVYAAPRRGYVDLGAMILNVHTLLSYDMSFALFRGECTSTGGCHDGALAEKAVQLNWNIKKHALDTCAFYHNENARSCAMVGGVWYDAVNEGGARDGHCFDYTKFPIGLSNVDWEAFFASKQACVCHVLNNCSISMFFFIITTLNTIISFYYQQRIYHPCRRLRSRTHALELIFSIFHRRVLRPRRGHLFNIDILASYQSVWSHSGSVGGQNHQG